MVCKDHEKFVVQRNSRANKQRLCFETTTTSSVREVVVVVLPLGMQELLIEQLQSIGENSSK